jgi:hypothetical protein
LTVELEGGIFRSSGGLAVAIASEYRRGVIVDAGGLKRQPERVIRKKKSGLGLIKK